MSRLQDKFQELKADNKTGLVIYITAGMPDAAGTIKAVKTAVEAGADVIELGIPFSDPMADGPVIQAASYQAIQRGMTLPKVLELVKEIRQFTQVPILGMGYINNMLNYGFEKLAVDAKEAGIDGFIIPDVPHEESGEMKQICQAQGLHLVEFVTPGTTDARISETCTTADGFIYCVSINGVTGVRKIDYSPINKVIERVKKQTDTPCAVGFGIGSPEAAVEAAQQSDAVIVGSAVVKLIMEEKYAEAGQLIGDIRQALDKKVS
ncbi:Tryptophan synthase alpha chain [Anaerovibrio sp. JC8]|nr:Tryptophan synthase alpha chain [Anaerovibrio sp. JC8]